MNNTGPTRTDNVPPLCRAVVSDSHGTDGRGFASGHKHDQAEAPPPQDDVTHPTGEDHEAAGHVVSSWFVTGNGRQPVLAGVQGGPHAGDPGTQQRRGGGQVRGVGQLGAVLLEPAGVGQLRRGVAQEQCHGTQDGQGVGAHGRASSLRVTVPSGVTRAK
jgi:hypothetical protein